MEFIWNELDVLMKFKIKLIEKNVLDKRMRWYLDLFVCILNVLWIGIVEVFLFFVDRKYLVS